ncbi:hypothetical protein F2Q70_00037900 [Brassica cretica]|uniref:Uncharacterized protein n=1 Tax=Brassica cretica TaxID=69181 RepID=A0A8S9K3V0_BRACR|nr:hypothetical protein F2Q70_00037900 [Brassica cretica]
MDEASPAVAVAFRRSSRNGDVVVLQRREYKTKEEEEGKPYYLFQLEETSTEDDSTISAKAVTGSIFLRKKNFSSHEGSCHVSKVHLQQLAPDLSFDDKRKQYMRHELIFISPLQEATTCGFQQPGNHLGEMISTKLTSLISARARHFCFLLLMSNHSIYLEKHMIFAALLDRVLEIPSSRFDYENDRVTDIDRINTCLGRSVVVSFDQCKEMDKKKKRGILSQSPHQHEASSVSLLIQQQLCGFVRSYEVSVLILSVASTTASVSHLLSYAPSSRPDHGNDHLNLQGSFLLFIPNDLPWR